MYNPHLRQNTGLPTKFEQFRQAIELTQSQRDRIIASHTHLRQYNLMPLSYVWETFLTGSYKRHTMIRPPNDVDIFVVIGDDQGQFTPNTVLGKLKRDLSGAYPGSIVRQDKPCVILDFKHCRFELTPAIRISDIFGNGYYIPVQGGNSWVQVESPNVLEHRLSHANSRLNGMLTPLIKMMKACKRKNEIVGYKSFELETKAIASLTYINSYRDGVQQLLRAYQWTDNRMSQWDVETMTDQEFASYCRNTLFGNDFPL